MPTPPGEVVDLGCGPGNLTATLADALALRARCVGLDSSAEMLARPRTMPPGGRAGV